MSLLAGPTEIGFIGTLFVTVDTGFVTVDTGFDNDLFLLTIPPPSLLTSLRFLM